MSALDLRVKRPLRPVTNAEIASVHTWAQAMQRAAELSGICDKALAADIGVDQSQFSRTKNGQLGILPDPFFKYMDSCGTELPLHWLNYQRGYDIEAMRQRENELQRQLREAKERTARLERDNEVLIRALRGEKAA